MEVRIADLDNVVDWHYSKLQPDKPAEVAYALLHATGRVGCGFTWPAHDLRHLLCWIWLCWHKHHSLERIVEVANPVLTRALSLYSMGISQGMRTEHDSWILHAAILCSEWDFARQAAKVVAIADPENPGYQYLHGWTGILKYMIEQDEANAHIQANIFHKFKPNRVFAWPRPKLVTAFMERDGKSFEKQLRDASKLHWTISEKEGAIAEATPDSTTLMLQKKGDHFFWPWVEAVFMKLALMRGMEIKYDDFWLPFGLIGANLR
jgi:hypothetical protein